jgi:HAD superfamily hydrolase (TIGR01509 family)
MFINKLSLVIFDMDGLMFDTEILTIKTWIKAGNSFGIDIKSEIVIESIGLDIIGAEKVFKKHLGKDFPYYDVRELRLEYTKSYLAKNRVSVKKGLKELMKFLDKKEVLKAVATSTERERTEQLLLSAGVKDKFDVIICGDEVLNGKPEPDIFLAAAEKLKCEPKECIVLEDSISGLIAALKASMVPIYVSDFQNSSNKGMAFKQFNSLLEVKKFLEYLNI